MIPTFRSMNDDFIDAVKKRRNRLLEMMRNSIQPSDVYTVIGNSSKKLDSFLATIKNATSQNRMLSFHLENFQPEERRVIFRGAKQSQVIFSDYLAFRFYDLYIINQTIVERYVHFEIYFDESILSVLMKKSAYNVRSRTFPEFDLDFQEWAQMKLQMQMWNQWYRPIVKTVHTDKKDAQRLFKFFDCKTRHPLSEKKEEAIIALFQESDTPWELFAWLIMIQMQRLDDKKHPLFFLNLKCSNPDNITERLQKYVSCFMFQTKSVQPENIQIVTQGPSTVINNNGIQRIFLAVCQSMNTYKNYVEFAEGFHHNHLPKQIPILLGNQFMLESVVWNLEVNEATFNSAAIASDKNLSQLRQLVVYHLYSIIFPGSSDYEKLISYSSDPEDAWERINEEYQDWHHAWKKWARKSNFTFIPPEYLHLAAWISIALYGGKNDDECDIKWLEDRLAQVHSIRLGRWNQCSAFFNELRNNADSYSKESPGPSDLEKATSPFVKHYADGDCILFPRPLFQAFTDGRYGEGSAKVVLDTAEKQGILRHSEGRNTLTYRYPANKKSDGKSETVQLYAFIISKLPSE